MTAIRLEGFGGMMPGWADHMLPEGQSSYALNAWVIGGDLRGWRQPELLRQLNNSAAQYVYRVVNKTTNNTSITAPDSKWIEFLDPDTNVMRSPVVQDQYDRHYACSPSQPPQYATYDMIMAGQPWWLLGIPASGCAPGVTITGGGDTSQLGWPNVSANVAPGTSVYIPGNSITLVPITPQGSMLIQDIAFMPASSSGTINYQSVVYSDNNGVPYQLLAVGNPGVGMSASSGVSSSINNGLSVIADVQYWVGFQTDEAYYLTTADTTGQGVYFSQTFTNGPPAFVNAGTVVASSTFQIWSDLIGSSVYTARSYVYTWVSAYGEEGPPSPPTVVNGWSNGTWQLDLFTPDPLDMGTRRNIKYTNIYRSITNQSGQGTYYFVAQIPVTQATYVDTSDDATVAQNQQLVSLYWFEPPADLQGIAAFPNGIAVGFRSNEVWFSEAYRPHAWPPGYVLTTEFPVVGIGICGQAIVVCTQGTPYLINGINPSAMALTKINLPEPCLHRGSIVSTDTTVLYVSQNGLVQISQSGAGSNITEGWVTRERWQELTPQNEVRAIKLMTSYFAFGNAAPGLLTDGYTVELSTEDQTSFTVWPQAGGHRIGFTQLTPPNGYDLNNVEVDPWTGVALLVQNGGVWWYDFTNQNPVIVPYRWRSKSYRMLSRKTFAAMKCWFTVPGTTPAQVARNVSEPQPTLGPNQYGIIRVFADGNLWCTRELRTSGELLRIYSGSKYESWQVEIESRVDISNLQAATSVKELGLV